MWKMDVKIVFVWCDRWMDGFSTFFVSEDGLVYKHKMDRVSPLMIDLSHP